MSGDMYGDGSWAPMGTVSRVIEIHGWRCEELLESRCAVNMANGVGFACSRSGGLWATTPSRVPAPPAVVAWLVYPLFEGLVSSDDLEDAPFKLAEGK